MSDNTYWIVKAKEKSGLNCHFLCTKQETKNAPSFYWERLKWASPHHFSSREEALSLVKDYSHYPKHFKYLIVKVTKKQKKQKPQRQTFDCYVSKNVLAKLVAGNYANKWVRLYETTSSVPDVLSSKNDLTKVTFTVPKTDNGCYYVIRCNSNHEADNTKKLYACRGDYDVGLWQEKKNASDIMTFETRRAAQIFLLSKGTRFNGQTTKIVKRAKR